jgi:hypothetical protein
MHTANAESRKSEMHERREQEREEHPEPLALLALGPYWAHRPSCHANPVASIGVPLNTLSLLTAAS